jgi:hypothetical protein
MKTVIITIYIKCSAVACSGSSDTTSDWTSENSYQLCEISGSHGSKYKDGSFLGYSAVQSP